MTATYHQYILNFKQPSGTSRGVLKTKETWFIVLDSEGKQGVGECGILRGLSVDDRPDYKAQLKWTCEHIHLGLVTLYVENTLQGESYLGNISLQNKFTNRLRVYNCFSYFNVKSGFSH